MTQMIADTKKEPSAPSAASADKKSVLRVFSRFLNFFFTHEKLEILNDFLKNSGQDRLHKKNLEIDGRFDAAAPYLFTTVKTLNKTTKMKRTLMILAGMGLLAMPLFAQETNLKKGLVAYYPFNGNANDESGNGNHGTVTGATLVADRNGESAKAYSFDGNDFIEVKSSDSLNIKSRTVSGWFKLNEKPASVLTLIAKAHGCGTTELGVAINASQLWASFEDSYNPGNDDSDISTSKPVSTGEWVHFLHVWNEQSFEHKLWINGQKVSSKVVSGKKPAWNNSSVLGIGATLGVCGRNQQFFKGLIDDIRIYNRDLTESEVAALYAMEKKAPEPAVPDLERGLVAYYPFNGNANDESGNGNDGAANGATLVKDRSNNSEAAYSFDGKDDFIVGPTSEDLKIKDSFSLSCWVYWNGNNREWQNLLMVARRDRKDADKVIFAVSTKENKLYFTTKYTEFYLDTFVQLPEKNWHQLTFVFSQNRKEIYLDGTLKVVGKGGGIPTFTDIQTLEIGGSSFYPNDYGWNGTIDDIRIYNRALSEEEISLLYESESPTPSVITVHPQSGSHPAGSEITLSVGVDESHLGVFIQWFKDGTAVAGANSANLTLPNAAPDDAGLYYALVVAGGEAVTSEKAEIVILVKPTLTAISESTVADEGETIELVVTVEGDQPFQFEWKKTGSEAVLSSLGTLTLATVDETHSGEYYVVVSNAGGSVTSPGVTLFVRPDTDNDGLPDHVEIELGTDITKADTDGDGLSDFAEARTHKTNPLTADSDGDGLPDGVELREGFDPLVGTEAADGALAVHTAIELEFFTLKSQRYVIQSSTDLESWENVSGEFQGTGGFYSVYASTREEAHQFWRLRVVE